MNTQSSSNRWVPFQCPSCFGVFRLRRAQIGSVGHCPTCGELVHVSLNAPALGEIPLEAAEERVNSPRREDEHEDLLEKVAVAQQMTPEEIAAQEETYKNQKRHYSAGGVDMVDWEKELGEGSQGSFSWLSIWISGMVFVLGLVGAAYYFKTRESEAGTSSKTVVVDDVSREKLDSILGKGEVEDTGNKLLEENVDKAEEFDFEELERVVKGFSNSGTVTERLAFVREPERVRPLMLHYYGGEQIEAEGYNSLDKTQVSYQKGFFTTYVQTSDFSEFSIVIENLGKDGDTHYLIDWESWVGYGDMKPEEMRERKPIEPQLMRVMISNTDYYNYHFSDELEWSSFRLGVRDSEFPFLGYLKRGSEMEQELRASLKEQSSVPFAIKVAYPPNSRSMDQVEVVEILSAGWVLKLDEEKDHE